MFFKYFIDLFDFVVFIIDCVFSVLNIVLILGFNNFLY